MHNTILAFVVGLLFGVIVPLALVSKPQIYSTELMTQKECIAAILGDR